VFGGTKGEGAQKELEKHKYNFWGTTSEAELEHKKEKRKDSLKTLAQEVDDLNKKEE